MTDELVSSALAVADGAMQAVRFARGAILTQATCAAHTDARIVAAIERLDATLAMRSVWGDSAKAAFVAIRGELQRAREAPALASVRLAAVRAERDALAQKLRDLSDKIEAVPPAFSP